MNKKQKLIKSMEHESISPKVALETALEIYSGEPDYNSLEALVKALMYAMLKKGEVYTAITGEEIPDNPKDILTGVNYNGFELRTLELKDGRQVVVALTSQEKLKDVPPTAFLEVPLVELMAYTAELEVDGLFINPGPANYYIPMEMLKGYLEQWETIQKLMQNRKQNR